MSQFVRIRFLGGRTRTYTLKLGPVNVERPPERKFRSGDEVNVEIQPNTLSPDCVDLTFEDGEFAIEVPREFFSIVQTDFGR